MISKKVKESIELFAKVDGVTGPEGFFANGISCGIKMTGKKDLAVIFSNEACNAAAVFTMNQVKAAPLKVSKPILKNKVYGIVCNSGNANACTGSQGMRDAKITAKKVEEEFEFPPKSVLVASTGIIGQPLEMEKINYGISKLRKKTLVENSVKNAAEAILTTDTKTKMAKVTCVVGNKIVTIGGIAKGSGMINPNMATMLAFLTTDAKIDQKLMQKALKNATKQSFNKITVDGQMSTNDTVYLLANGLKNNATINKLGANYDIFEYALTKLCKYLAMEVVNDGEGVTKVITIKVNGAKTKSGAEKIAREVANSPLVKTAFYGYSANWGRIIQAIGAAGVAIAPGKINITLNNKVVCEKGMSTGVTNLDGRQLLNKRYIDLVVELGVGKASDWIISTDLSYDYVKINSQYS